LYARDVLIKPPIPWMSTKSLGDAQDMPFLAEEYGACPLYLWPEPPAYIEGRVNSVEFLLTHSGRGESMYHFLFLNITLPENRLCIQ
jgi:hypothetical protein